MLNVALHCTALPVLAVAVLHCSTVRTSCTLSVRPMAVTDGEHHVSYLLDGFQSGDCGERCGRHFPDIHVHITAVFADSHRRIFFRDVFRLFDIFRGLFHLRLAVDNRVGHCIQVIVIP